MISTYLDHSTKFSPANVANGTAYRIDCDPGSDRSAHYLGDDRTMAPYWVDASKALVFATHGDAVAYARARLEGEHAQYNRAPQSRPGLGWRVEAFDYSRGIVDGDVDPAMGDLERAQMLATFARNHGVAAYPVVRAGGTYVAVQSSATFRWSDDVGVTVDHVDVVPATWRDVRTHMGY